MKPKTSAQTPSQKSPKPKKDLLVFITNREGKCAECGDKFFSGSSIFMDGDKPLCLHCAGLDHLDYLPPGNATLTRRAGKHSPVRVVLLRWSRARKHYERQGILVTPGAIELAEKECHADAGVRERRRRRARTPAPARRRKARGARARVCARGRGCVARAISRMPAR